MDELRIEDEDHDGFTLMAGAGRSVNLEVHENTETVRIHEDGARAMVAWLQERFGLATERVSGFQQSVTLTVPGIAGGSTREVAWMGDGGAPEWLRKLAEIALTGSYTPAGVSREDYDRMRAESETNYTALRQLIEMIGADDFEHARTLIGIGILRQPKRWEPVLRTLGAEGPERAAEIAQTWRTWLDEAGRVLIREGVADASAQTAIDPVKAINRLLNAHAANLKAQTNHWHERERDLAAQGARNAEDAVAREREARAALSERLTAAELKLKIARDALEYARAQYFAIRVQTTSSTPVSLQAPSEIVARLDKAIDDSA